MTRMPTVNRTSTLSGESSYEHVSKGVVICGYDGRHTWAKKASYQKGHFGLITAINSGETAPKTEVVRTT